MDVKRQSFDSDEFRRLTKALADATIDAGIHYQLYRDLLAAIPRYRPVFNQAAAFWTLTLVAHRDAAVTRLCRVFDTDDRALGLSQWLALIGTHKELFSEEQFRARKSGSPELESLASLNRIPEDERLRRDQEFASEKTNPLVKKLIVLRNNMFAHQSVAHAFDPDAFLDKHKVDASDLVTLANGALSIINHYSTLFEASSYASHIVGEDDYVSVLRSVAHDMLAEHKRVREEYRAAGGTDYPDAEYIEAMLEERDRSAS